MTCGLAAVVVAPPMTRRLRAWASFARADRMLVIEPQAFDAPGVINVPGVADGLTPQLSALQLKRESLPSMLTNYALPSVIVKVLIVTVCAATIEALSSDKSPEPCATVPCMKQVVSSIVA